MASNGTKSKGQHLTQQENVAAATLHFEVGMNHAQIAAKLHVDGSSISKSIKRTHATANDTSTLPTMLQSENLQSRSTMIPKAKNRGARRRFKLGSPIIGFIRSSYIGKYRNREVHEATNHAIDDAIEAGVATMEEVEEHE
jgi:IS30 family transposase